MVATDEPRPRRPPGEEEFGYAYLELTFHAPHRVSPRNGVRVRVGPLPGTGALAAARDAAQWEYARDVRVVVSPCQLSVGEFATPEGLAELTAEEVRRWRRNWSPDWANTVTREEAK